jgi:hydroxyethylthiazole kinase-like uncharacterized protein yjeF
MVSRIPKDPEPRRKEEGEPEPELYVLDRASVREVDRLAIEEYGIPSIVLMENASFHIADVCLHILAEETQQRIVIVCGPGNNGGDGLAAARHLHNAGATVELVLTAPDDAYSRDAAANLKIARAMGLRIAVIDTGRPAAAVRDAIDRLGGAELIVDAVLGTGLNSAVREPLASVIQSINRAAEEHGIEVLSVDIPSGLDADSGQPLGVAVKADVTVSMVGLKTGFTALCAQSYIGDVVVVDIGAPKELTARLGTPLKDAELPERFTHPPDRTAPEDGGPAKRLGDG